MFARKYHVACTTCHGPAIPRLNEAGYKFRRAGFRMPEQIGQDEASDFNLGDYFSAQVQAEWVGRTTNEAKEGESATSSTFVMPELTLYPLTGSFQRHWATLAEIAFAPEETPEIGNAYIRAVWGAQNLWVELRAGIFHPIEGFGASDRPLGVAFPLFEAEGAFGNQDTLFRLAELNRLGAEAGIQWKDTSFTVQIVNGISTVARDGEVAAVGTIPTFNNREDLVLTANQIFGPLSGVGAFWAHGATRPPIDEAAFAAGTSVATWRNAYDRIALFASVGAGWFTGLAAGALGFDHSRDPVTGALTAFRSGGAYVEGDASVGSGTVCFLRLDYFDPSADIGNNAIRAVTAGAVWQENWIYATPEFQFRSQSHGEGERRDASFILRIAAIY
jgi:hypothetical protein